MIYLPVNLRFLRGQKKISIKKLSEILRLSRATIADHESGRKKPSFKALILYREFYEINLEALVYVDLKGMRFRYEE